MLVDVQGARWHGAQSGLRGSEDGVRPDPRSASRAELARTVTCMGARRTAVRRDESMMQSPGPGCVLRELREGDAAK